MSTKMFEGNKLPYELLLETKQKKKLRSAFEINMLANIKSKTQISKIIQASGFLGTLLIK